MSGQAIPNSRLGWSAELRTERLLMRRWLPADREPFAAMNADPQVTEHFLSPLSREGSHMARLVAENRPVSSPKPDRVLHRAHPLTLGGPSRRKPNADGPSPANGTTDALSLTLWGDLRVEPGPDRRL